MNGRVPFIILRFSKQVPPPPAQTSEAANSSSSEDDENRPADEPRKLNSILRKSISSDLASEGDMAKKTPKISSTDAKDRTLRCRNLNPISEPILPPKSCDEATLAPIPSSKPALQVYTGKRKRDIPKSIGGGKGDLKPSQLKKKPKPVSIAEKIVGTNTEKRVLRSQDTTRRSEYEEWFEAPKDELDYDMKLPIVRGGTSPLTNGVDTTSQPPKVPPVPRAPDPDQARIDRLRAIPIETIDLEEELRKMETRPLTRFTTDPLGDEVYIAAHKGEERREKRMRNIEREQLAHNAQKLEQDLEKLQSPEWIKAIGLSAAVVNAATKQELDERRHRLMRYLEGIIEKHKAWKEDERRKKLGLPRSVTPRGGGSAGPDDTTDRHEEDDEYSIASDHDGVDGESLSRLHTAKKSRRSSDTKLQHKQKDREKEFTSFYSKPYLRDQALSASRKSSRTQTAFGQTLPVFEEREYTLPAYLLENYIGLKE